MVFIQLLNLVSQAITWALILVSNSISQHYVISRASYIVKGNPQDTANIFKQIGQLSNEGFAEAL